MRPIPGFLDLSSPTDVATEIALAANAGIGVFLYDCDGLAGPWRAALEKGFLQAPNRGRMKFALRWNPRRRMDAENRPLSGTGSAADEFETFLGHSVEHCFGLPEYWCPNGKPFLAIDGIFDLVEETGADRVKTILSQARAMARAAGLGEIVFCALDVPFERVGEAQVLGIDVLSHGAYGPCEMPGAREACAQGRHLFEYAEAEEPLRARHARFAKGPLPYVPSVTVGWDPTPRCRPEDPQEPLFDHASADVLERMLRDARTAAENDPKAPGAVFIASWNQYADGCWLVTDSFDADARLRAVAAVFGRTPANEYSFVDFFMGQLFTVPAPTFANLAYDMRDAKQKIDVWLPQGASGPVPLVVYIHGGGWCAGGMVDRILGSSLTNLLDAGIAVAAVGYRFIPSPEGERPPVMAPLNDAETALRLLLSRADEWGIDRSRVALAGGSAGAATSIYLAFKNDNEYGIHALAPIIAQTSMDPREMKAWIPNSNYGAHAFGYRDFEDWLAHRGDCLADIERISGTTLARKIDPAKAPKIFLQYAAEPVPGVLPQDPTHTGEFGVGFKKLCDELGIPCVLRFSPERCFGQAFDGLIAELSK